MIDNESIKRFRFEAVEFTNGIKPPPLGITKWNEIRDAKFAELIVRECSQFVEDKFDFCGDEIIIAEKIKEHFGVKE